MHCLQKKFSCNHINNDDRTRSNDHGLMTNKTTKRDGFVNALIDDHKLTDGMVIDPTTWSILYALQYCTINAELFIIAQQQQQQGLFLSYVFTLRYIYRNGKERRLLTHVIGLMAAKVRY